MSFYSSIPAHTYTYRKRFKQKQTKEHTLLILSQKLKQTCNQIHSQRTRRNKIHEGVSRELRKFGNFGGVGRVLVKFPECLKKDVRLSRV